MKKPKLHFGAAVNEQSALFHMTGAVDKIIALAGNPNVGKSTVFNNLTGMRQHTGNWPGKTVETALGEYIFQGKTFRLVDLPGTYSLLAGSPDEEVARDVICSKDQDVTLVVVDATCLERNLNLVLQILHFTKDVVVCVNLMDEAEKRKIKVDFGKLSFLLGVPVVGASARSGHGLSHLKEKIFEVAFSTGQKRCHWYDLSEEETEEMINRANEIYALCVITVSTDSNQRDRKLDRILTSRKYGIPIMVGMLAFVFWITLSGANVPSQILSDLFSSLQTRLSLLFRDLNAPWWLSGLLLDGLFQTVGWVVSVMLPPMAIFFPLFSLLEDSGYLPRIAFNMDRFFRKASAHGKQALTMCMGFGCNACGVTGCRIIDSPRERLIAILTNNFVPCNGRFPTLIAIITMFFVPGEVLSTSGRSAVVSVNTQFLPSTFFLPAVILTAVILFGILMTGVISKVLSLTILKGMPSSFALELPPYRRPQIGKVILRSVLDRTIFVLGRAVTVAAPAGILIWLLANTDYHGLSLLTACTSALDPFAKLFGLDGVILLAFLLGFPANEIVMPIVIMCYLSSGSLTEFDSLNQLHQLLVANGWTWLTALCMMLFSLMHFPCGTTCWTIKKETQSLKWTMMAILVPTVTGLCMCFLITGIARLIL